VNNRNEMLQPGIERNHARADLIRETQALIWDEAPAANQAVLNCASETCQRCTESQLPFGGKTVILLGDFRQTCPVVKKGSRIQIIQASIRSSPLWKHFTMYRLTLPIRNAGDLPFAHFVDAIGDGAGPEIPLTMFNIVHSAEELTDFVYPTTILSQPAKCLERAILAPTNEQVNLYNSIIMAGVQGEERTYFATDRLQEMEDADIPSVEPAPILDYQMLHTPPGMPPHRLNIKVNSVCRLLRNISIERGLVKNVRVVVVHLGNHLITVRILRNDNAPLTEADDLLIPRINFTADLPSGYTLLRKQFPLAPSYATTFNSCQGMTLRILGIDLTRNVFSHGQLYTALSRVRKRQHARIRLLEGQSTTTNVTFDELLA